jgi:RimJ/RimL family protein N-acetyltransferase
MNYSDITIETERLYLEPVSATYREDMFREFSPEVTTYMYPAPAKNISETDAFIALAQDQLQKGTDINLAILDKETKEYLGGGGIHNIHTPTPEFGIWIKKSAHGNMYGREAVHALKIWADSNLDAEYYTYPVDKRNIGSKKVAESLGGVIVKEYTETNMSGDTLDELEYHIPVSNT